MSKAQMSQAFTYIAIALMIGVIAYFGIKAVMTLIITNCEQQKLKFTKDINGFVEDYTDLNSVHYENVLGPCDAYRVCFVDSTKLRDSAFDVPDEVIADNVKTGTNNIFFVGKFTEPVGLSGKLTVNTTAYPTGMLCTESSSGRFSLKFTGTGRKTQVDEG